MSLLDTVNQIETTEAQRRRRSMAQIRRRQVPQQGFSPFGVGPNLIRPGDRVPPVSTGYDMREVLARMHNNFLENRQRFQEMRARQVAMFQAAQNFNVPNQPSQTAPAPSQPMPPQQPQQPNQPLIGFGGGAGSHNGFGITHRHRRSIAQALIRP